MKREAMRSVEKYHKKRRVLHLRIIYEDFDYKVTGQQIDAR